MPLVPARFGIGDTHVNEEAATWVACAAGPPLLAVEHDLVAHDLAGGLHVGGVARRDGGFGHGKARTNLSGEQRPEPSLLLLVGTVLDQNLGIAGVGCAAVEHLRREKAPARDLGDGRVVAIVEPGPVLLVGQEQIPEPERLGLGLQLLEDRRNLPFAPIVAADQLVEIGLLIGHDPLADEALRLCHHVLGPLRMLEIHRLR